MSTLSSCYLCGTAMDAPVESYPLVPEGIPADDDHTISLCPTCQRKLHGVLELAFAAVDGIDSVATTLEEYEDLAASAGELTDESSLSATTASSAEVDDDAPVGDEGDDAEPEPSTEIDEGNPSSDTAESDDDATDDAVADSVDASDSDTAPSDSEGESTAVEDDSATSDSTDEESPADNDGTADTTADEPDSDDGDAGGRPSILSTPAAKKVIRLLQNREFPVDREEFTVVASNAYDIPEEDCADVLDALVSEGYVGEKRGKLVRE